MKKLIVLIAVVLVASVAFGQLSYVGNTYKGSLTARSAADSKLGGHDVLATQNPFGAQIAQGQDRNGCQSCHVPHNANPTGLSDGFLWAYNLPAGVLGNFDAENGIALAKTNRTFHTLACMSCHDGATASNVVTNNSALQVGGFANFGTDMSHTHPIDAIYSHGNPKAKYVRLYDASGAAITPDGLGAGGSNTNTQNGYVECASCHDPHAGDDYTYAYLRGPGATFVVAAGVVTPTFGTYAQTDRSGLSTITYTGTSPQWARLGICRDCHGK